MNKQELIDKFNKLQEEQDKEAKKERKQYPLSELAGKLGKKILYKDV